jgi:hypothetical protein
LRRGKLIERMTFPELATLILSIEKHGEIEVYYDVSFTGKGRIMVQNLWFHKESLPRKECVAVLAREL